MKTLQRPFLARSMRNTFAAGLLAASAAALTLPAQAASGAEGAVDVVNGAVEQTMDAVADASISDTEADAILNHVDVPMVAKFALGKTWNQVSEDKQARYSAAFETYAKAQLKQHLSSLSDADVEVADVITRKEGDAIVVTKVATAEDPNQKISWRVIETGAWGIVDIQVQDVWFAIQQREQFQAVLDRNNGDIDALIAQLNEGAVG